ncbi:MAG: YafY family transcriptional regulator [Ktedonobacteraceae bacterium]|nr:YafY family transcriptional regulator [Ktedonobacteraceae bacterium]
MQKMERLVAISLLLQARGKMTAGRLADILGVSTRTIYRDITSLSLAHVPVSMDYGPGGGYYLPDDYHFESAIFTREEAVSLVLSTDIAGNSSLFADDDGLHRALFKLEAALPEEYRSGVQIARERILIDRTEWCNPTTSPPYLETLRSAVFGAYQLDILYPDSGQWRHIEPYGLVFKGVSRRHVRAGIWYLVAYCLTYQRFVTFRVSYIEGVRVRSESITFRPDFDLQAYWQEERKHLEEQPYTLKLKISPPARYRLKGNFTLVKEKPDGSVIVRVEVESLDEAVSYVLGLGADATVLAPGQVRDAVAHAAQAIAEMYDQLAT